VLTQSAYTHTHTRTHILTHTLTHSHTHTHTQSATSVTGTWRHAWQFKPMMPSRWFLMNKLIIGTSIRLWRVSNVLICILQAAHQSYHAAEAATDLTPLHQLCQVGVMMFLLRHLANNRTQKVIQSALGAVVRHMESMNQWSHFCVGGYSWNQIAIFGLANAYL